MFHYYQKTREATQAINQLPVHVFVKKVLLSKRSKVIKMKLLTHNMLTSNIIKGVTKGFPLGITATKVEVSEVDFNPDFITRVLPKLDFPALRQAASQIGHGDGLPDALPDASDMDEGLQKALHNVLLQVEVLEGELVCPESGRKFPIQNGIPNMLLNEDEVS